MCHTLRTRVRRAFFFCFLLREKAPNDFYHGDGSATELQKKESRVFCFSVGDAPINA